MGYASPAEEKHSSLFWCHVSDGEKFYLIRNWSTQGFMSSRVGEIWKERKSWINKIRWIKLKGRQRMY